MVSKADDINGCLIIFFPNRAVLKDFFKKVFFLFETKVSVIAIILPIFGALCEDDLITDKRKCHLGADSNKKVTKFIIFEDFIGNAMLQIEF